jgi:hypothetical protein
MGEQSNAWQILLRNDRKSRHRSDVAMEAWPPQASYPCGKNAAQMLTSLQLNKARYTGSIRFHLVNYISTFNYTLSLKG